MSKSFAYLVLGFVTVLLLSAISTVLRTKNRFGASVWVLSGLSAAYLSMCIILVEKSEDRARSDLAKRSTISTLLTATNGLYEVVSTCQDEHGKTLAILNLVKITEIDLDKRQVSHTRLGGSLLISLDHPIASPQCTNMGIFTGYVEISNDGTNKVIQPYRPIPAL